VIAVSQDAGAAGLRETLRLANAPETWVILFVVLPLITALAWLGYRNEQLPARARAVLSVLRGLALALIALVLARPVRVIRHEEVQKAEVIVLADDSASMRRADAYAGDERMRRAVERLTSGAVETTPRGELVQAALAREIAPEIARRGYSVRAFAFALDLVPHSPGEPLACRGHATHVGDALTEALATHRGRHVTDVILVSDGRSNGGLEPAEAARAAAASGIPVHTVVVGDARPARNVVLELIEAPSSALEGDEVAIAVRVRARGLETGARSEVRLEEEVPEADGSARRVLASEDVALSEDGERVTLVAPPEPAAGGERRFHVQVEPVRDETLQDDNALTIAVRISPEKVRVLYVEGYPRYEYRRLALDMLKRADANIEFQAFLLSATPDFVQESSRGVEPLAAVPTARIELLERYDVVLLGDVNPYAVSADPAKAEEFQRSLVEFVESGGGLAFLAGEYDDPRSYLSTPLEDLLPVLVDPGELAAGPADMVHDFRGVLEDKDHPHEVVRLHPDLEVNRRLWEDDGGLKGFDWYLPVQRAKPGSQVLLRHPREANQYGRYPLLVAGYYPSGRTLFVGVDSTWRWQFDFGPRYHERFWRNAIRWLALGRMKSGDRRYRIDVPRSTYDVGERVTIEARVLDEDYRPSESAAHGARWSGPDGRPSDVALTGIPGRAGLFRGAIDAERTGTYRVWFENAGQRIADAEFEVVLPSLENEEPAPAPEVLSEISRVTGGVAVDLARLDDLLREMPGGEERHESISARLEDVWDRWGTLIAALVLLSIEWVLRKRYELV
jgi:uncharacterized membrane protein